MDNLAADFEINPNNPLNCSFELFAAGTVWGSIDGDINNQTDLINLLNTKVDLTSFEELSQTVTNNYNELTGDIADLTTTVTDNYNTLSGQISDLTGVVNDNYTSLDNRLTTAEGSILDLTDTVNDNYTELNGKITTTNNNLSTLNQTVENNNTAINNRVDRIVESFDGDISDLNNVVDNLTDTVTNNYTDLNEKITVNSNDITTIQNTINSYGDIVTYDASDFATKNQGLLADSALQPNDNITLLNNNAGFITNAVNDLTNYYLKTETYTKTEVQQLIASIPQFSVVVVQTLPVTGERMVLYLVPKEGTSPDVYNEYIWVETDEDYELIGNTAIDLSDYVQFTDLATVATTGDYDDLSNKPTIPTATSDLTNDSGFITVSALNGYATETWVGQQGYITGITSSDVTTALGYVPYNSTNPSGYTTNVGTVTSVNNIQPDASGNVTLTIPDTSNLANKDLSNLSSTGNAKFQAPLVSGTNIKTLNGNSILGSGDLTLDGLPSQTGQSGKFLTTDGTTASWGTAATASNTMTFTNKTFDANGTGNSISNLETADFATGVIQTTVRATASASNTALASEKAIATALDGKQASGNYVTTDTAQTISAVKTFSAEPVINNNIQFENMTTGNRGIWGKIGVNDFWRVCGGATGNNAGYIEIATANDGNEPIYVRQYTGQFNTLQRTATLLNASGNTELPGSLSIGNGGATMQYNSTTEAIEFVFA